MNKKYLNILVATVVITMLGLILIQLYWINNAVALKDEAFYRNVNDALNSVVNRLEKEETIRRLKSHEEAKFLFIKSDSLQDINDFSIHSTYGNMILKKIEKSDKETVISLLEVKNGVKTQKTIIKQNSVDSNFITPRVSLQLDDVLPNMEVENGKIDSSMRKRVVHKTAIVGDIVKSLMEVNLNETIQERVNLHYLDSLLHRELTQRGVNTSYLFGIYGAEEEPLLLVPKCKNDLQQSELKIRLFPNDILNTNNYLKIFFPNKKKYLFQQLSGILIISLIIVLLIISAFVYAVKTILTQKELSEIKNDFINNMTHELKTPIATISLACEALSDESITIDKQRNKRYIKMINEESKRLDVLVQNVLQSAIFNKGQFQLQLENIDMHLLITSVCSKLEMQINQKKGSLKIKLEAKNFFLEVDQVHFNNLVSNLIDNAIKYSTNSPMVEVLTTSNERDFIITVKDNGIGIEAENKKKIFDKFYRVPTGNLHDTKGFGFGLSYVKIIAEKHGGNVSVESKIGKGSAFSIIIPFIKE